MVGALVVALLAGGAYYSSRVSESAPKVVYSTSFDEAKAQAQAPLLVNINTADAKELDELPEVGPSTAEKIIEYRRHNGSFKSVDELEEVQNYKNGRELRFRAFRTCGWTRLTTVATKARTGWRRRLDGRQRSFGARRK